MDRGLEQLIFFGLILLAGLLDWMIRLLRHRRRATPLAPREEDLQAFDGDEEMAVEENAPVAGSEAAARHPKPTPRQMHVPAGMTYPTRVGIRQPAVPARHGARPRAARWVGDARALRRAIVLMEILGPCRGLDQPRGRW